MSADPAAPAVDVTPPTPSWATGEFWVALAPLLTGVATIVSGHQVKTSEVTRELIVVGTIVAGVYALARTLLKAVHVRSATQLAIVTAQLARQMSGVTTGLVSTSGMVGGGGGAAGGSSGGGSGFSPVAVESAPRLPVKTTPRPATKKTAARRR